MARIPYQDIWRGGRLVQQGRRECAGRYAVIRDYLGRELGEGFTVADVGGWDGYFPVRLAEDLTARATNIDARSVNLAGTGVEHIQMRVDARTVQTLGRYDAILALSVLHHMEDWADVLAALRERSRILIVETPHPDEVADAGRSETLRITGHRFAALYEAVMSAGEVIGESVPISSPGLARPIVAIRNEAEPGIEGVVEDGTGKAAVGMRSWPREVWEPLGYIPVPGTMNVRVGMAGKAQVRELPGVHLDVDDPNTDYRPVLIAAGEREARGHVRLNASRVTVELVSDVHLRSVLRVANGDTVTIRRAA